MNLLESYIDERLIKSWTIFCEPPATDLRYYGHSSALFDVRELIHLRRLEDRQEVKSIYISLFKCVLKDGANFPYFYRDEKHPLEHWWFDKIADKSYLAELLSEHLMEFYLKAF
jgi:hypothetical protein